MYVCLNSPHMLETANRVLLAWRPWAVHSRTTSAPAERKIYIVSPI